MPNSTAEEICKIARIADLLRQDYPDDASWAGSPFEWIRRRQSSRQKGTIGEKLVSGYLTDIGFNVDKSPSSEADRLINGTPAEIKMSTLWGEGFYMFQQLRDQNYSFVICLGISPLDVHCWVLPKKIILDQWKTGGIHSQHRGQAGRDTAWLQVDPEAVPEWLQPWGGQLSELGSLIHRIIENDPHRPADS